MLSKKVVVVVLAILLLSGCVGEVEEGKKFPKKPPKPEKSVTERIRGLQFGKWEQLQGLDGGDMHFIYSTKGGILFLSHGFGGVWRSEDGGRSWKMIMQDNFVDLNFYDIEEIGDKLYAGSNRGLWVSRDGGVSWEKVSTGFEEIDSGKYHIVSLANYKGDVCFTAVLDKAYRNGKPGDGKLLCMKNGRAVEVEVPASEEIVVAAKGDLLFISSPYSGLYVFDGKWRKILDAKTTKVFVDDGYNLYVGTIADWWYIGEYKDNNWEWKHVVLEEKDVNTVFHFIVPDPANKRRLWFGCGGISTFYSFSARGSGNAFVGVGCWDGEKLEKVKLSPNYATSIAFYGDETVDTPCGKATKVAFVTVGGQAVQKTEDGGLSWHNSYEGVYGDTINAISPLNSGILAGSIVITAVSGTEIATDHGDSWLGVDFRIGKVDGKLPGYSWRAASPDERVKGRYDLLISTGYPGNFGGDGIFGVDTSCLKSESSGCVERLLSGVYYDVVVVGDKLYAGNMDDGVDVLNLKSLEVSKIRVGNAKTPVPVVKFFDGKLYFETYRGKFVGDGWKWTGKKGEVYLYDGEARLVYEKYVINFYVNGNEFVALTPNSLVYKPDIFGKAVEVSLPSKKYTDMAVDWDKGLIFLSTDGEGVFYTTLDEIKSGKVSLREINDGLMTLKIRNLAYSDGYLFAGTRGHSVWRLRIT